MRAPTLGAGVLALTCVLGTAAAHAQELLVMPYACSMAGGRPLLTPAHEQSHAVVGQREQRTFTACSEVNPRLCRTWTVHRFDVDCGGARVPWVSVVGAAAEQGGIRAWAEDGRLRLRMGWQWGMEPDDPCARGPGWDDTFAFGRMRRYCADRRAMMRPPVVEMPVGFAPMLGIDGIFVKAGTLPATAGLGPQTLPPIAAGPQRSARAEAPPLEAQPFARPQQPAPIAIGREAPGVLVPPQATEPPMEAARAAPAPQAAPPPQPLPPPAPVAKETPAKAPPAPPVVAVAAPAPKPAPPAPAPVAVTPPPGGGSVIPKIINRPEPPPAALETASAPHREQPAAEPPPVKIAAAQPPKGAASPEPGIDIKAAAGREPQPVSVSFLSVARSPVTGAIAVFAGLTVGLLTAFFIARRRDRVRFAGAEPRDITALWLQADGKRAEDGPAQIGFARGQVPPNAAASTMNRVPASGHGPMGDPAIWGDAIPQTRADAMQVLGMGVSPRATDATIKKIVDVLRLAWHPDHAQDEADRQLREHRMKQINAAWDILRNRAREV